MAEPDDWRDNDIDDRPAGGEEETISAPARDDAPPRRGLGGPALLVGLGLLGLVLLVFLVARAAELVG